MPTLNLEGPHGGVRHALRNPELPLKMFVICGGPSVLANLQSSHGATPTKTIEAVGCARSAPDFSFLWHSLCVLCAFLCIFTSFLPFKALKACISMQCSTFPCGHSMQSARQLDPSRRCTSITGWFLPILNLALRTEGVRAGCTSQFDVNSRNHRKTFSHDSWNFTSPPGPPQSVLCSIIQRGRRVVCSMY